MIYTNPTFDMSISSVGSQASVSFHGAQQSLDLALDQTVRDLIKHMNAVQFQLRSLAMAPDQDVPFEDELKLCAKIADDLRQMSWLFDDLRRFQFDLLSEPNTAEDKALLRSWKIERKAIEKAEEARHAALVKEEIEAAKADKARMKAESKMDD